MRQFVAKSMPADGVITAKKDDYRHLRKVLRVRSGDMINVRAPDGTLLLATVCKTDDDKGIITMQVCKNADDTMPSALRPSIHRLSAALGDRLPLITIFQFIPRIRTFETIVRQAVECAVSTIVPVAGEYSQSSYAIALKDGPTERVKRVIKEAMEQSGSPCPINITRAMKVEEAIKWHKEREAEWRAQGKECGAFVLSERDLGNDCSLKLSAVRYPVLAIAVGCEGGISAEEERLLNEAHFQSVHFDCNIMRCETAAVYAAAVLSNLCKEQGTNDEKQSIEDERQDIWL